MMVTMTFDNKAALAVATRADIFWFGPKLGSSAKNYDIPMVMNLINPLNNVDIASTKIN